jgi:hypothetical protein
MLVIFEISCELMGGFDGCDTYRSVMGFGVHRSVRLIT